MPSKHNVVKLKFLVDRILNSCVYLMPYAPCNLTVLPKLLRLGSGNKLCSNCWITTITWKHLKYAYKVVQASITHQQYQHFVRRDLNLNYSISWHYFAHASPHCCVFFLLSIVLFSVVAPEMNSLKLYRRWAQAASQVLRSLITTLL